MARPLEDVPGEAFARLAGFSPQPMTKTKMRARPNNPLILAIFGRLYAPSQKKHGKWLLKPGDPT